MKQGITILFLFTFFSCAPFKEPEYKRLENFRFAAFSFQQLIFKTDVVLYNPNKIGIKLLSSHLDIYINDRLLGTSIQSMPTKVLRASEFTIPLTVEVATGQLTLSFIKGMWNSMQQGKVKVTIKGNCVLKKGGVPLTLPINYSELVFLQVPKLF